MKTILALLFTLSLAIGADIVTFNASLTENVTYRVRWGAVSGRVDGFLALGTNQTVTLTNGPWGPLYYTAVSVSTNGIESRPSEEVQSTNRPSAPTQLRIIEGASLVIESSFDGLVWFPVHTNEPIHRVQMFRAATIQ